MRRVALTVASPSLDVGIEPRFGRSALFLVVDPDTMGWETVGNRDRGTRGGARVGVAQILNDLKVTDVVSGEFEPKTHDALETAGITMHRCDLGTSARQALDQLKAGELPEDFWR